MYFAMDEIGYENEEKIKLIALESDKWKFIFNAAETYGFDGIHFTPSLYEKFNLNLNNIPDYFKRFKLTFHFGGMYKIVSEDDYNSLHNNFNECFDIAVKHNMHDISIHPPYIYELAPQEKQLSLEYFCKFIESWINKTEKNNISFTLENHVSRRFFQFDGLSEYAKFVDIYPELGVLIDISHSYYDGYLEDEVIKLLGNKNIKGLHISDALQGTTFKYDELRRNTHLPVGNGAINFPKVLNAFTKYQNLYGVLEIKSKNEGIVQSLINLNKTIN